jgi:hypothetical protein
VKEEEDCDGAGSTKSVEYGLDAEMNFICADEGRIRRLLRSKS